VRAISERVDVTAALWHAAFVGATAVMGLALAAAGLLAVGRDTAALAVGAAPALLGLLLSPAPRLGVRRTPMLIVWAAAGATASVLTGGVGGPLGAWCLAPVTAAVFMREPQRLALAAALSLAAAGAAALGASLLAMTAPPAPLAAALGLLALATIGGGLGAGVVRLAGSAQRDRLARGQLGELLLDQPQLLLMLSGAGRIEGAVGRAPEDVAASAVVGCSLVEAAAPADRPQLETALGRALSEGAAEAGFAPSADPSGWVVAHLRRRNGDEGLLALLRDGRAQRAREAELERARDAAQSQSAGKSRFLANMSHELRTPLNAIMGFSDIMRQRLFGPLSDRYVEYAELVHESGGHLLELINDILDMSKIEAERYELSREVFDARDAIAGVLRLMRGQADRAEVQLRGVLPREPLEANADRRALKQIALNLISNALKFTPKGGSVTVTALAVGDALELVVADTGVGIGPEDIARLGNPYEQAGEADQRNAGTGLGLSLVKAFARLHGGELEIESELGEGTTVTVRLPVLIPAGQAAPEAEDLSA
jgi:cell cycle sensor histidine kinase DivJ